MLNTYEIEELIEVITDKILLANRQGELEVLLKKWGVEEFLDKKESVYETEKNGKIVIIGQSDIKIDVMNGIIKSLGLDKKRFEFCLEYDECKTYNYNKLRYSPKYRVILFGPVPHSTNGTGESKSVIAELKNKEGYPRVLTLNGSNELKITKTTFRCALEKLIEEDYI